MYRARNTLRLSVENLESRQMLAGDVDVFAIGNVLYINGDEAGNGIVIAASSAGVIDVKGIDRDGAATTINGEALDSFVRIKNISIKTGDGDDAIVLTHLNLTGSVTLLAGKGNDVLALGAFENNGLVDASVDALLGTLSIEQNLTIDMNLGDDTIVGRDIALSLMTAVMAEGNDSVSLTSTPISTPEEAGLDGYLHGLTAESHLGIDSGPGQNSVTLNGVTAKNVYLNYGDGADSATLERLLVSNTTAVSGHDGPSTITIKNSESKSFDITMGIGNDQLSFEKTTSDRRIKIADNFGNDVVTLTDVEAKSFDADLGFGDDQLTLTDVTLSKSADIAMGDGNDTLTLSAVIASALSVALGKGNDQATVTNLAVTGAISFSGGDGADTLTLNEMSSAKIKIALGKGVDNLSVQRVISSKATTIDGGEKTSNTNYTDLGDNSFANLKAKGMPVIKGNGSELL